MTIKIHTINVGHGDSLIIEINNSAKNYYIVIDCHNPNKNGESPTLTFLKQKEINELDFVFLTHADRDHFSGMYQLLDYFSKDGRKIGDFVIPTLDYRYTNPITSRRKEVEINKLYSLIAELAELDKLTIRQAGFNTIYVEENGIKIISLTPFDKNFNQYVRQARKRSIAMSAGKKPSSVDSNLISIILLIQFNTSKSLLCSDATVNMIEGSLKKWIGNAKEERRDIKFNFIKVSHHGSKYNHSTTLFKEFTQQNYSNAAISCGAEWPHEEVISSLKNFKINTYATSKTGCLKAVKIVKNKDEDLPLNVKEGLDNLSMLEFVDEPFHGNISFIDDTTSQLVETQFNF
ncbi:MAG: hypothetical protein Q8M94_21995, partial [Ignavibacteria bacterium]|nr:hypothetical protein [Ignavibacteria bacterium]